MAKGKFKVTCKNEKVIDGLSSRDCREELVVEIEDSPNCEQEAANALCRKLEQHFKDKHPKEKRGEGRIAVNQGDKWATLQADGTIKELAPTNAFNESGSYQLCKECGRYLIFFVDGSIESHNCSKINPGYKCLNCGKKGKVEEILDTDREKCLNCNSRSIEIKLLHNHDLYGFENTTHFTVYECPQCHLYKDIQFHDLSEQEAQVTKQNIISEWKKNKKYCNNSSHVLDRNNSPTPRTPNNPSSNNNSPFQNQPSNKNSKDFNWTPWLIGGGIFLLLIGIGAWLFMRNKKEK